MRGRLAASPGNSRLEVDITLHYNEEAIIFQPEGADGALDTLTHALLGVCIGGLRRRDGGPGTGRPASPTDRAVFWSTLAAAELPDIDALLVPGGPLNHIRYHRGLTHSLPFAIGLAAVLAWWAGRRWPGASRATVFRWSLASVLLGHLAADWITGFGTRLLLPFSGARLALDWVSLFEPLLILPLVAGLVLAWRRPAHRHAWVAAGLVAAIAFVGYRGWSHGQAVAAVRRAYGPAATISAQPTLWGLRRYEYVAEQPHAFHLGEVHPGAPPREYAVYPKPGPDPVLAAAGADPRIQEILDFARHALLIHQRDGEQTLLTIADFRGGYAFNFRAVLDHHLEVLSAVRDYSYRYPSLEAHASGAPVE